MAEELRAGGRDEVLFIGTPDGLEARLVPEAGVAFVGLPAKGFDRSRPLSLVTALFVLAASTIRAHRMLGRERPAVVAGFGGYVSIPVGLAAVMRGVPLVLHEQNSVPGLANRVLSRWAHAVGITYEGSARHLHRPGRAALTGNPVRRAVLAADRRQGRQLLGVPDEATMLLVFGGSRGARHINNAVVAGGARLLAADDVHVVHVAGREEVESVRGALERAGLPDTGRYHVLDYLDDMGSALAAADLVLSRAGATSIAEITALGRPAILVPYPHATDDHQTLNARAVVDAGAGRLVADADLDDPSFIETVTSLLGDPKARATMAAASAALGRPDAGARVAAMVRDAAAYAGPPRHSKEHV